MVFRMTHMTKRGAVYWFRYKLPPDLGGMPVPDDFPQALSQLVSASKSGHPKRTGSAQLRLKIEVTRSLRTGNSAEAKRKARQVGDEVDALCQAARRFLRGEPLLPDGVRELTPELSATLANDWRAAVLLIDEVTRKAGINATNPLHLGPRPPRKPGMSAYDLAVYRNGIEAQEAEMRQALAACRPPDFSKRVAQARLATAGIVVPQGSEALRDVELDFVAAERQALREIRARLDGEVIPTPPLSTAKQQQGVTLREAFKRWSAGNPAKGAKKPSAMAISEADTCVRRFVELHGDLPIASITKRHARELLDALARVPKSLPPKLRNLPLPSLLKRDLSAMPLRSAATVNKSMQLLGGVLAGAEREGFFDDVAGGWSNPFHVKIQLSETEREPYQAFDIHELNKLFASPVYAKGERPIGGQGDAAYWLPLLALFTGARRTELAQLRAGDVRQDVDSGVWFFSFHAQDGNRLKTSASRRITPVHPALQTLGILDYACHRRTTDGESAPLLPAFAQPLEPKTKAWSKWFSRYLAAHVVDDSAKCFHSFRGTFKRFARGSDLDATVIDALVGHAAKTVGQGYGRRADGNGGLDAGFPMVRIAADVAKITFPGVVLPQTTSVLADSPSGKRLQL